MIKLTSNTAIESYAYDFVWVSNNSGTNVIVNHNKGKVVTDVKLLVDQNSDGYYEPHCDFHNPSGSNAGFFCVNGTNNLNSFTLQVYKNIWESTVAARVVLYF